MANQDEGTFLDDFLKFEAENQYSRESDTLISGQDLLIGAVVGKILFSVPATGTLGSGTNGACTSVSGGLETKIGTYKATCTTANESAADGVWRIEAPNGAVIGDLTVTSGTSGTGSFTDPQINLTIEYATGYSTIGDYFGIAVVAGSEKLTVLDFTTVDGSQIAHGLLIDNYDASSADLDCVAIVRDAVIAKSPVKWTISFTGGGTHELVAGETITGATSTTITARVCEVNLTSGTWAGGDAAGTIVVDQFTGDFAAENIKISGGTDDATVAATDTATAYDELKAVGIITREEA